MNTDLRKNPFKKVFSELENNALFRKTMENVKKHNLVITKKRKISLSIRTKFQDNKIY